MRHGVVDQTWSGRSDREGQIRHRVRDKRTILKCHERKQTQKVVLRNYNRNYQVQENISTIIYKTNHI